MFKKSQRLDRATFTQYFKTGRRFQSSNLTLVYIPGVPFGVSAVVGKKVAKQAVDRNRTRRRIYAATRRFFGVQTDIAGVHIIIAKPTAAKITRLVLAAETAELLALAHTPKAR